MEQAGGLSRRRWLDEVEAALSDVYASAVRLPSVDPATEEPVRGRMSTDEFSALFASMKSKTGTDDRYWQLLDPSEQISLAESSLADDLAEIYMDLRASLDAARSGAAPDDVMFEWRTSFDIHWATHAVGALGALRAASRER